MHSLSLFWFCIWSECKHTNIFFRMGCSIGEIFCRTSRISPCPLGREKRFFPLHYIWYFLLKTVVFMEKFKYVFLLETVQPYHLYPPLWPEPLVCFPEVFLIARRFIITFFLCLCFFSSIIFTFTRIYIFTSGLLWNESCVLHYILILKFSEPFYSIFYIICVYMIHMYEINENHM